MAQTHTGAMKARARATGMTFDTHLSLTESGQKWCTKCRGFHDKSEFGKDCTRYDGLASKCLKSIRVKERKQRKGVPSGRKGFKFSDDARRNMGRPLGIPSKFKGIPRSLEDRKNISAGTRKHAVRGERNPRFKDGKSHERRGVRFSAEYARWRFDVFARDKFQCQRCGDKRGGNLHAHHILSFSGFPEFRFSLSNGLTLCERCHRSFHSAGSAETLRKERRVSHGGIH